MAGVLEEAKERHGSCFCDGSRQQTIYRLLHPMSVSFGESDGLDDSCIEWHRQFCWRET